MSAPSNASATALLRQSRTEKNYFTAYGTLQSTYGFGGVASAVPSATKPAKSSRSKSSSKSTSDVARAPAKGKDYEAAYGALSTMYGFSCAAVPSK